MNLPARSSRTILRIISLHFDYYKKIGSLFVFRKYMMNIRVVLSLLSSSSDLSN